MSLYTGKVALQVPIHTVQGHTLSLPISLSYHGGGVRVAEVAGAAGLGWTLNAGGAITRVVRGLPDDVRDGYLHTRSFLDGVWGELGAECCGSLSQAGRYYLDGIAGRAQTSPDRPSPVGHNHTHFDSHPDVFLYNFAGHSGKFVVEPGGIRMIPHQNLKITYTEGPLHEWNANILSWKVVTDDGTEYVFTEREGYQPSGYHFTTAWYLTEIRAASGTDVIELAYERSSTYSDLVAQREADLNAPQEWKAPLNGMYPDYPFPIFPGPANSFSEEVYVSEITSATGTVEFSLSARHDLAGLNRYSSVLVKDETGARVRRVALNHSYFNEGVMVPGENATWSARLLERLRLDSVQIFGETDQAVVPPYTFEYFVAPPGEYELPQVTSTARDHWGYYNGKGWVYAYGGNPTLVPNFVWDTPLHADGKISFNKGSDREPDASGNYMRAGSLSMVTYPTGGWTSFEYEPHTYSKIVDVRLEDLAPTVGDDPNEQTVSAYQGPGQDNPEEQFSVTSYYGLPVSVSIEYAFYVEQGTSIFQLPHVELWQGGTLVWSVDANSPDLQVDPNSFIVLKDATVSGSAVVSLSGASGGTIYILRAFEEGIPDCGQNYSCEATVTAHWRNKVLLDHPHTLAAGGLRVARTVSSDGNGSTSDVITEYSYLADEDTRLNGPDILLPDRSSGVLVRAPRYLAKGEPIGFREAFRAYGSDIDATGMGSHIGYRQVSVQKGGQGRTVSFFLTADGMYPSPLSYDISEVAHDGDVYGDVEVGYMGRFYETSRDWKRGLPTLGVTIAEGGNDINETRRGYIFSDTDNGSPFPYSVVRGLNFQLENDVYATQQPWPVVMSYSKYETLSAVTLPSIIETIAHDTNAP